MKVKQLWKFRKFTPDQIITIRSSRRSQESLAREYGVCKATISKIKTFKSYQDIKDATD